MAPPRIQGLAPLLQVFDMPASLAFYRDKLGFEVTGTSGQGDNSGWVMLQLNEVVLMLNTAYDDDERPAQPDMMRMTGHIDTAIYFGCPEIDIMYEYMKSKGLEVDPPSLTGYGFKAIYLRDPDGFMLVFQWPAE